MSRIAAALLLASSPATLNAAPARTAEEAITKYEEKMAVVPNIACRRATTEDEIVVCGRRSAGPSIPFEREPGEVERHINEPQSGGALVSGCVWSCPPAFGVTDKMVRKFVKGIGRLLEGDD